MIRDRALCASADFAGLKDGLTVVPYEGLDQLPGEYAELLTQAGATSIFLGLSWFRNLAGTVMNQDERVVVYGIERTGKGPIAIFVMRRGHNGHRPWRVRRIDGLANYYSSYYGPILACDDADAGVACRALAKELGTVRRRWDVVELRPLDPESITFPALVAALRTIGTVQTFFCFRNWYLRVEGRSFRQYQEGLPTALRETIRRKSKKLESMCRGSVEIVTGGNRLDTAIQAYQQVYRRSWKRPEPYPEFIPALIKTWAEQGYLRLGIVRVEEEPAAAQLWGVNGRVASIFKLAYDERFTQLSAGTVLTSRLMQHVIDVDRVEEVDYLSGDDAYKRDWMSHCRERWGILAFNTRSIRGRLEAVRHLGGRAVKRTLGRLLNHALPVRAAIPRRSCHRA